MYYVFDYDIRLRNKLKRKKKPKTVDLENINRL